ncbi:hypothetical protein BC830DRAFT_678840 [Chytriomyces sp. MP71]|nr:hypothetical protein BC830DRAFT_678840 [Chytriomyces sp. MP71]
MQSPQAQGFHSVESPMHHANGQPSVRSNRSAEAEEEVRTLREQLDRAKLELERQAYMNNLLMYQQRIQSDIYSTASTTRAPPAPSSLKSVAPSDSTSVAMNRSRFYPSGIPSFASGATSASDSGSCVSRRSKTKSSTGWSGRSSQRFPGKIADAIIDDACNIELHSMVPVDAVLRAVSLVKEFYSEKTNKGAGASQAIMAIMYVCNLDDPAYVRRSMEVTNILMFCISNSLSTWNRYLILSTNMAVPFSLSTLHSIWTFINISWKLGNIRLKMKRTT